MAKKMAKSMVGKSIRCDLRFAPNVLPGARAGRARAPGAGTARPGQAASASSRWPGPQHHTRMPRGDPGSGTPGTADSALGFERVDERREHLVHVADNPE